MTPALFFFSAACGLTAYAVWCLWPAAFSRKLRLRIGRHRAGVLTVNRWRDHS